MRPFTTGLLSLIGVALITQQTTGQITTASSTRFEAVYIVASSFSSVKTTSLSVQG